MRDHAWCRDVPRDEAVRAAEDGRSGPLPTLEEAMDAVTDRRPPEPGGGGNVTDLRTERVTLEITHSVPVAQWDWTHILETYRPGESVRVVEETHFDDLAQVAMERDAAIRERDNLRAERITQTLTADRFAEAVAEADALRGRVASLESQLESVADRAAAAETALEAAPAASGWRMLEHWEIVQEGDEILWHNQWSAVLSVEIGTKRCEHAVPFRRRVPAPAASGAEGTEPGWLTPTEREAIMYLIANRSQFAPQTPHEERRNAASRVCHDLLARSSRPPAPGWLTAEEREAVEFVLKQAKKTYHHKYDHVVKAMESLLARSSPPEVVRPKRWEDMRSVIGDERDAEWFAALAAAGVAVKEVARE